ncbi:MAG TPA: hypothetical protein VEY11_00380 [Pyrinomonadaceae bacterium]|nr:hypothetical protein [Pyrinomonadaceae bacterium]
MDKYYEDIVKAFKHYYPDPIRQYGDLYGVVYYFHRKPTGLDADNLSKPVWDALTRQLFDDDRSVKIRYAGTFMLESRGLGGLLDLSSFPPNRLEEFFGMIDNEEHTVYVECGRINYEMYKFGCEAGRDL